MEKSLIPIEHATEGTGKYGLGRFVSIDPRDKQYALPTPQAGTLFSAPKEVRPIRYRYYATAKPLDQGDVPQCVAYAWEQFLLSAPVKNKMWQTPAELYHQAQLVDEWEGEDYDGTSVRAGAKVLQTAGLLSTYNWATDARTAADYILNSGPVVMGTNWYWDMFSPDKEQFIHVNGALAGGHAYMVKGVNLDKKCPDGSVGAFRIINSWGSNWGDKGMVWISFNDMNRLILEWGESCTATEIKFQTEAKG